MLQKKKKKVIMYNEEIIGFKLLIKNIMEVRSWELLIN